MKIATLLVVPCAITLMLGGVLLWPNVPTADSSTAQASQHAQSHPHDPEQEAVDALQARYRTFVSAQSSLTVPTEISLASLQILFDEREQLRQQSFTPAEQAQLFAEDRLMEQLTLRRRALAEARDSDKSQLASELDLWLAEQPGWFREAEANSRLLEELQELAQMDPAKREALLLETGGGGSGGSDAPAGAEPARVRGAAQRLSGRAQTTAKRGPGRAAAGAAGTLVRARPVAPGRGTHPAQAGGATHQMRKGPVMGPLDIALIAACWHPAAAAR